MQYAIILVLVAFAFIAGAVGGILVYRNNVKKLQSVESKARELAEAAKKISK
jgi:uncharacterized protein YneF (UPF0154 family)